MSRRLVRFDPHTINEQIYVRVVGIGQPRIAILCDIYLQLNALIVDVMTDDTHVRICFQRDRPSQIANEDSLCDRSFLGESNGGSMVPLTMIGE